MIKVPLKAYFQNRPPPDPLLNMRIQDLSCLKGSFGSQSKGCFSDRKTDSYKIINLTTILDNLGERERSDLFGLGLLFHKQRNLLWSVLVPKRKVLRIFTPPYNTGNSTNCSTLR